MSHVFRFPLTTAAIVFAVLVMISAVTMNINVMDLNLGLLEGVERSELDELVTSWVFVVAAFAVDHVLAGRKKDRQDSLRSEQIRVVHVTMRTVQDIVGNCLTELQLLRMEAEGSVHAEALSIFDESIRVASAKLRALEELKTFSEKQMAVGFGLDVQELR